MTSSTKHRNLTIANFAIVTYFIILGIVHLFKIDFVLFGVLTEFLTIPLLIAQIVFIVIGINTMLKNKANIMMVISVVALVICSIVTIGSLFWS